MQSSHFGAIEACIVLVHHLVIPFAVLTHAQAACHADCSRCYIGLCYIKGKVMANLASAACNDLYKDEVYVGAAASVIKHLAWYDEQLPVVTVTKQLP
jgi:hypothetical protein